MEYFFLVPSIKYICGKLLDEDLSKYCKGHCSKRYLHFVHLFVNTLLTLENWKFEKSNERRTRDLLNLLFVPSLLSTKSLLHEWVQGIMKDILFNSLIRLSISLLTNVSMILRFFLLSLTTSINSLVQFIQIPTQLLRNEWTNLLFVGLLYVICSDEVESIDDHRREINNTGIRIFYEDLDGGPLAFFRSKRWVAFKGILPWPNSRLTKRSWCVATAAAFPRWISRMEQPGGRFGTERRRKSKREKKWLGGWRA